MINSLPKVTQPANYGEDLQSRSARPSVSNPFWAIRCSDSHKGAAWDTNHFTLFSNVRQKLQSLAAHLWPSIMGMYHPPTPNPERLSSMGFALCHLQNKRKFTGTNTSHSPHSVWVRALLHTAIFQRWSPPLFIFLSLWVSALEAIYTHTSVSTIRTQGMTCTDVQ